LDYHNKNPSIITQPPPPTTIEPGNHISTIVSGDLGELRTDAIQQQDACEGANKREQANFYQARHWQAGQVLEKKSLSLVTLLMKEKDVSTARR
jgi:hypothetical protein